MTWNNQVTPIHFRPLNDYVLVQREALPEQSQAGLYILGRDFPTCGRVLAVGPGRWRRRLDSTEFLWSGGRVRRYRWIRERLDLMPGDFVQWAVGYNFDLANVPGLGPDILLLRYDDLNFRGRG
jgi:hypothetical protein